MQKITRICLSEAGAALSLAMQAHTGFGTSWPLDALSEASGIKLRQLYRYRNGEATPPLHDALTLIGILGPTFANMLMEPVRVGGAFRLGDPVSAFDLPRVTAAFHALWVEHISDGVHDHCEKMAEEPLIYEIIAAAAARIGDRSIQRVVA